MIGTPPTVETGHVVNGSVGNIVPPDLSVVLNPEARYSQNRGE